MTDRMDDLEEKDGATRGAGIPVGGARHTGRLRRTARYSMALLAGAALAACSASDEDGEGPRMAGGGPSGGGPPGGEMRAVPVAGEVAAPRDLEVRLRASTNLMAREEVEVLPKQQGVVASISVEEGDRVRAGQVLAELDDEEWRLQLRQAEARNRAAQEAVERARALQEQGLYSDQEVEGLESEASVTQADLELAELRVRNAQIVSPIDGVVTHRFIERGQLVATSSPAFGVSDDLTLQARVGVPERQAHRVEVGQRARVQADEGSGGVPATGRVVRIRPVVDPESGTVQVTVELEAESALGLRPGRFVNVDIVTETLADRLAVPRTAVIVEGAQPHIYVIRDGRGQEVEVELGHSQGDRVEIRSGLQAGDTIVVVGQDNLQPGMPVRLMELDGRAVEGEGLPEDVQEPEEPSELPGEEGVDGRTLPGADDNGEEGGDRPADGGGRGAEGLDEGDDPHQRG